ncbi:MAG: hypothetical protein ACFN4H_02725 [Prevotella sp.]
MLKITFEGNAKSVMFEMKALVNALSTNGKEAKEVFTPVPESAVEMPKNWTTQDVQPEEPKQEEAKPAEEAIPMEDPMAAVPIAAVKEYKLEELQVAMQPFINTKLAELQALLAKYKVASLVDLPKDQYGVFAADLRALGAQI